MLGEGSLVRGPLHHDSLDPRVAKAVVRLLPNLHEMIMKFC